MVFPTPVSWQLQTTQLWGIKGLPTSNQWALELAQLVYSQSSMNHHQGKSQGLKTRPVLFHRRRAKAWITITRNLAKSNCRPSSTTYTSMTRKRAIILNFQRVCRAISRTKCASLVSIFRKAWLFKDSFCQTPIAKHWLISFRTKPQKVSKI